MTNRHALYRDHPTHASKLPRGRSWPTRIGIAILAFAVFLVTAGILFYQDLNNSLNVAGGRGGFLPYDHYAGRAVNVLVLGSDTRSGKSGEGEDTGVEGMRSDTMMIAHIAKDRKSVSVISIPRDTMVDLPSCKTEGGGETEESFGQVNSAFSEAAGNSDTVAGIECAKKTVEANTGVRIDEYVLADFNGFSSMVDSLGGLKLWLDEDISDEQAHIDLKKGCNHLNGKASVGYARLRYIGDGSDLSRIQRQQRLLGIMIRTALKKNLLTDLSSLYGFTKAGLSSLTVSSGFSSLAALGGFGNSLRSIDPANVRFATAPNEPYPLDPDRVIFSDQAQQVWEALIKDTDLPTGLSVRDGNSKTYVIQPPAPKQTPKKEESAKPEPAPSSSEPEPTESESTPSETPTTETSSPVGAAVEDSNKAAQEKCEP
ncbi:LCP family protein [Winkia sp. UMB3158]|uniref:Cell envelope-related transcriptional attenuator domain-containing protein n=2 Tax=Winkia neuii TaxID=33007 RepID=K0YUX9_9ACTO|nr:MULTISPECIES: LCP family protein [Winkia]MDK8340742.1 LCP family protein [Winkia sp. UMB3164B]PLB80869.1 LytR family transcriptional regulator [Actinomyces sp. UMB0138]PMC92952.1 LytR family transcriptional regulator [Actinomyces sp. UMB0918]EJZ87348.1 hypothetical protein HMPREF9240_00697 [Winkia neuii BV029A5]MBS5947136.1 LCP family protein [Winkia neuii]